MSRWHFRLRRHGGALLPCLVSSVMLVAAGCSSTTPGSSMSTAGAIGAPPSAHENPSAGMGQDIQPSPTVATPLGSSVPAPTIDVGTLKGRILFTRAGGDYGDETVFTADADGANERRITALGATCCPRWAPDGSAILTAALAPDGKRITTGIFKPDGTLIRKIPLPRGTLNLGPGAWSPDGTHIAFQGWDDADPSRNGIYIARATDGGALRRVTSVSKGNDLPGDFSPDGKELAFFRENPDIQSVGSVFVTNVDGTGIHQVTPDAFPAWFGTIRWSPNGRLILFATGGQHADGALWVVRPDGSGLTRLFVDVLGRFAISPTWSPDGSVIMFGLDPTADEHSHPDNGLYLIRADGTGLTLFLGGADFKREPDWVR